MKFSLQAAIRWVIQTLFGDWNGVQALLYPTTLIYLLNSFSFLYWMSGVFTQSQHFLPFSIFSLALLFVSFIVIKFYSFRAQSVSSQDHKNDMIRFLIELHKGLFLVIVVSGVLYLLYVFLNYFYSIQLPIKKIYAHFLQYISIVLIMFYYIQSVWTKPFRAKGMSYPRAIRHVMVFARHNLYATLTFSALLVLIVISSAKLYHLVIVMLISPCIDAVSSLLGFSLRPEMLPVSGMSELLYNLLLIFSIFMVSNLIYAPIIALFKLLIKRLHPLKNQG
ncbi:MAG TPA: hypothetical protein P5533_05085 [Candidatus Cloacimonadota bacterium]|nr:hypothetical protein [Candidatus Cloacimonadota bacterium]